MSSPVPLCIDLDGSLIYTDSLVESFFHLLKQKPFYLLLSPLWLIRGRAAFKNEVARHVALDVRLLPYRRPVLDWLEREREGGRSIWLCTAANHRVAAAVAEHLGLFDGVIASTADLNLSGHRKASALLQRFGERGFDYCGNARVDLPIWAKARSAIVVGDEALVKRARQIASVERRFEESTWARLRSVVKALRLHQWAKNILVFAPLVAAHQLMNRDQVLAALIGFLAYGFCASSVYLLNDMLDLEADRVHPRKRTRPFASGSLSLSAGLILVPTLLAAAFGLSLSLPWRFSVVLGGYYVTTMIYSLVLKRMVLLDAITLAGLYTSRILAGAFATEVPLSFWMMLFSVFLFLSLALVKRYAELLDLREKGGREAFGRGYQTDDLPILYSLGCAAGYSAVLVLGLYVNSPEVKMLYRSSNLIWGLCPLLLYWISRIWLKTHRGKMHDDPLVFALTDKVSLLIGGLAALVVLAGV